MSSRSLSYICAGVVDPVLAAKTSEASAEVMRLNMQGFDLSFSIIGMRICICFPDSKPELLNLEITSRSYSMSVVEEWICRLESLHAGRFIQSAGA